MNTQTIEETVYTALTSNRNLMALLSYDESSVYHFQAPSVYPDYPIIVYSVISDVPALAGDNSEYLHEVSVRIHIVAGTPQIYEQVRLLMQDLGFARTQTTQFKEDGKIIQAVDFDIVTGVD